MTREEAMEIIKKENLKYYNLFGQHPYGRFEVAIRKDGNRWATFMMDERGNIGMDSEAFFESELEAWDNFIWRLRKGQGLDHFLDTMFE